ncbi:MAG: DedA family protein [Candidatus Dormibacteraceae bacterium]
MHHLPHLIRALAPFIEHYGYAAIFLGVLLEDFGVPLPGETLMIAGAVFAGLGRLSIVWVLVLAFLGAVIGDNIGYAIGHLGGRRLVLRFGRYVLLTPARLDDVERFFNRHGGKVVLIARFVEVLRQANGIVAGIAGMPWPRFLLFESIGAALWVAAWGSVGYFAGDKLDLIYGTFTHYLLLVAVAAGIVVLAFAAHRTRGLWWRRR